MSHKWSRSALYISLLLYDILFKGLLVLPLAATLIHVVKLSAHRISLFYCTWNILLYIHLTVVLSPKTQWYAKLKFYFCMTLYLCKRISMKPNIKWDIHWQVAAKHIMIQCQIVYFLEFALLSNFSGLA